MSRNTGKASTKQLLEEEFVQKTEEEPEFKIPKYTNLSENERAFVEGSERKYGSKGVEYAYKYLTLSIDNNMTQFLRYIRATNPDTEKNPYLVKPGDLKGDGNPITVEEAKKHNDDIPDLFSEEYEEG